MASYSSIDAVQFGIGGDSSNKRYAVTTVTNEELFIGNNAVQGGLYSPEMGPSNNSKPCVTCGEEIKKCIGHFGTTKLKYPVMNPMYIRETGRWLKVVCIKCGHPVIDPEDYKTVGKKKRLITMARAAQSSSSALVCKNEKCKKIQPRIEKDADDNISFSTVDTDGTVRKLYPHDIQDILHRITDETVFACGRGMNSHPRDLVLMQILIPPVSIRPSVESMNLADGGTYHDIMTILQYIIKKNNTIPDKISSPINVDDNKKILNLQQLYYDLVVGSSVSAASGKRGLMIGDKQTPSLMKRLEKKTGRIRGNLLGRRTWFICRTTISGNPAIRIYQTIIPRSHAQTLQIRKTAHMYNRADTIKYMLQGRKQYPSSSRVIKKNGAVYDSSKIRDNIEDGDEYLRDLIDKDTIMVGRQPSLEDSAIGGHELIVSEDPNLKTMQFNVSACKWYGADFDGDQMLGFAPRTVKARMAAYLLSMVWMRFISSKNSGPVNGQVQDSNLGCFELTKNSVRMNRFHAMQMTAMLDIEAPVFSGSETGIYTGRDITSGLLNKYPISLTAKPSYYDENFASVVKYDPTDTKVVFSKGRHVSGVLDKKVVGEGAVNGVFHLIARDYGSKEALDSIYGFQQAALRYLANKGFSVGLYDLILDAEAKQRIADEVSAILKESNNINKQLIAGEILPPIGMTVHEFYEKLQINALKESDMVMRIILKSLDTENNGMFKMPATGSKGNWPNLKHIVAFIGQIDINQERIKPNFSQGRTSPFHARSAVDARASGFITNGYVQGVRSDQFIFSDMNGRYDLINKALSTSITGYQMRKSVHNLQSAIVDYYRRVCINNKIIQYIYGEDGLNPRHLENVKIPTIMLDNKTLEEKYRSNPGDPVFDEEYKRIVNDRDFYRRVYLEFESINFDRAMNDVRQLPINVERLVDKVAGKGKGGDPGDLASMVKRVQQFCDNQLPYVLVNEIQERGQTPIPEHIKNATNILAISVRCELNSKTALRRLNPTTLEYVLLHIRKNYAEALVDYGTGVGFAASQAICEPLTQYMLDSHHRSIAGGTNKSGITRVKEILGARPIEEEQSSEMLIRVKPEYEKDQVKVREVANSIEMLTFQRFVKNVNKLFERYGNLVYPPLKSDEAWIASYEERHPLIKPPSDLTSWCIWVELDKTMLLLKGMELEQIIEKLRVNHPYIYIVHNTENSPRIKMRIYVQSGYFGKNQATSDKVEELINELVQTPIRGVPGIQNVSVVTINRQNVNEETGAIVKNSIYAIRTVGTNIYGVCLNKYIDPYTIVSTSIGDTFRVFGIELARQKIISELRTTVESARVGSRHIMIYADVMTSKHRVTSLEKSGLVAREKDNVLLNSALQAPTKTMEDAAINERMNKMYGTTAPIMVGGVPDIGTFYCDVAINEEFVRKNTKSIERTIEELE